MNKKRRERSSARRTRNIAVAPALVTLLNVICGFAAIHFAARGMQDADSIWLERPELNYFAASAWAIILAMVCDALDGFLARMTGGTSSFGGQLDSLADIISFGMAPAFLMLAVVEKRMPDIFHPADPIFSSIPGKLLWLIAVLYICCAALRLARFNVESRPEVEAHMGFSGLPSPAAAGVLASLVLLKEDLPNLIQQLMAKIPNLSQFGSQAVILILPIATVCVALLMVSRIPYRHLINQYIRGRHPFSHVVRVVIIMVFLLWQPQLTLTIGFIAFASVSVVQRAWQVYSKRKRAYTPETIRPDK
ncbi:MAG: phosphatidylcholine/phosphatidylserine synthase [Planctomycetes bacterium]|nr:phosphatidylcholine/phosphatidylserine synthase [Planctomycetota bacterium]